MSLRLPAGVAQELHRTRTKPLLTSRSEAECSDPIYQILDWVMDFFYDIFQCAKKAGRWSLCTDMGLLAHLDGSYGIKGKISKWWPVVINYLIVFPQWDSLKIRPVVDQRQTEELLCCVFGLSHFCKCLNVSVDKRCFATVGCDWTPNFPQHKLTHEPFLS